MRTGPVRSSPCSSCSTWPTWGWWLGNDFVSGDPYHNVAESMGYLSMAIIYVVANIALAWHVFHGA